MKSEGLRKKSHYLYNSCLSLQYFFKFTNNKILWEYLSETIFLKLSGYSNALCAMLQNHTLLSGADYCTMHSFAI